MSARRFRRDTRLRCNRPFPSTSTWPSISGATTSATGSSSGPRARSITSASSHPAPANIHQTNMESLRRGLTTALSRPPCTRIRWWPTTDTDSHRDAARPRCVVKKFVEFHGDGAWQLPWADRAAISNMALEYGAAVALFPTDEETLRFVDVTGRAPARVALIREYLTATQLFCSAPASPTTKISR